MEVARTLRQLEELFDCKDMACYVAQQSDVLSLDERNFAAYSALARIALKVVPFPRLPREQEQYWDNFTSFDSLAQAVQKYAPPRVPSTTLK